MARAKAHHIVPQHYLRAWSGTDDRVLTRLRSGRSFRAGTTVIGQETDFYALFDEDGGKNSAVEETFLKPVDGAGSVAIGEILAGTFPLSPVSRLQLAHFLAVQWMRGRRSRELVSAMEASLTSAFEGFGLEPPERPKGPTGAPESSREMSIRLMMDQSASATQTFAQRDWHLISFDRPQLLTSDEPISLWRRTDPSNAFVGVGPQTADEIWYPLSPSRALVMGGFTGEDFSHRGSDEAAHTLNTALVAGHWDQLFRHPDGPAFPAVAPRPAVGVTVTGGPTGGSQRFEGARERGR